MDIPEMRERLMTMYPSGHIRGRWIYDMPDDQVYAIYKSHVRRSISTKKPRIKKNKQIPGQMDILGQM